MIASLKQYYTITLQICQPGNRQSTNWLQWAYYMGTHIFVENWINRLLKLSLDDTYNNCFNLRVVERFYNCHRKVLAQRPEPEEAFIVYSPRKKININIYSYEKSFPM